MFVISYYALAFLSGRIRVDVLWTFWPSNLGFPLSPTLFCQNMWIHDFPWLLNGKWVHILADTCQFLKERSLNLGSLQAVVFVTQWNYRIFIERDLFLSSEAKSASSFYLRGLVKITKWHQASSYQILFQRHYPRHRWILHRSLGAWGLSEHVFWKNITFFGCLHYNIVTFYYGKRNNLPGIVTYLVNFQSLQKLENNSFPFSMF